MAKRPKITRHGDYVCTKCGKKSPTLVILKPKIWNLASKDEPLRFREMLCLQCIENNLKRKVIWQDLKPCGVTNEMILGALLYARQRIPVRGISKIL